MKTARLTARLSLRRPACSSGGDHSGLQERMWLGGQWSRKHLHHRWFTVPVQRVYRHTHSRTRANTILYTSTANYFCSTTSTDTQISKTGKQQSWYCKKYIFLNLLLLIIIFWHYFLWLVLKTSRRVYEQDDSNWWLIGRIYLTLLIIRSFDAFHSSGVSKLTDDCSYTIVCV